MQLTKEARINYWREHIKSAATYKTGIYGYGKENKISKSALYRWKKHFSDLNNKKFVPKKAVLKNKEHQSPFLPIIVNTADLKTSNIILKNSLPDARWLAEVITYVLQGLS